ncbi:MAG: hypothetical protein MHMPM18_001105 [Marteilia pararefringens]
MALTKSEDELNKVLEALGSLEDNEISIPNFGIVARIIENLLELKKFKHFLVFPSLLFYNLHTIDLLQCRDQLNQLQSKEEGGFSSAVGEIPDSINSYFCINILAILDTEEAFKLINKPLMFKFLSSLRIGDGSFLSNRIGDIDLRCIYCALVIAKILDLPDQDILFENTVQYILKCQSFSGGFSSNPGSEVHSGYTYCAVASLVMLDSLDKCDITSLRNWVLKRSRTIEGAFTGRAGKSFCTCYTLYVGSIIKIINNFMNRKNQSEEDKILMYFDEEKLIKCLRGSFDHPSCNFGKNPLFKGDIYHTCYTLGGISVLGVKSMLESQLYYDNSPIFNIRQERLEKIYEYFN